MHGYTNTPVQPHDCVVLTKWRWSMWMEMFGKIQISPWWCFDLGVGVAEYKASDAGQKWEFAACKVMATMYLEMSLHPRVQAQATTA